MLRYTLAAVMASTMPAWSACQGPDAPITGRLALLETRHPNGQAISGWVLMTGDVCIRMENLDGNMTEFEPRIVHLVFPDGRPPRIATTMKGEEVTARGDLMEAHTAWHLGDLVMMDAAIVD